MNVETMGGILEVENNGPVTVVRLTNPPLNLLTVAFFEQFSSTLRRLSDDPEVRALVVTGYEGGPFSAGSDMNIAAAARFPNAGLQLKVPAPLQFPVSPTSAIMPPSEAAWASLSASIAAPSIVANTSSVAERIARSTRSCSSICAQLSQFECCAGRHESTSPSQSAHTIDIGGVPGNL